MLKKPPKKKNGVTKKPPRDVLTENDRLTANVAAEREARWAAEVDALTQRLLRAKGAHTAAVANATEVRLRLKKAYKTADDDIYNLDTGAITRQDAKDAN